MKAKDIKQLTVRQKYLLDRIPHKYNLNGLHIQEPKEVTKARAIVNKWEKKFGHLRCVDEKKTDALLRKAREAVYFSSEEKALGIIRQVEKLLKTCAE